MINNPVNQQQNHLVLIPNNYHRSRVVEGMIVEALVDRHPHAISTGRLHVQDCISVCPNFHLWILHYSAIPHTAVFVPAAAVAVTSRRRALS